MLVGASGAGKSSLLSAGLVPALQEGRWAARVSRPARSFSSSRAVIPSPN